MNKEDLYRKILEGKEKIITILEIEKHLLDKRLKLQERIKKLEGKL